MKVSGYSPPSSIAIWSRETIALHDEARAFLARTYVAQGRPVEAAGLALSTLSPYLSWYSRAVTGNAGELVGRTWD